MFRLRRLSLKKFSTRLPRPFSIRLRTSPYLSAQSLPTHLKPIRTLSSKTNPYAAQCDDPNRNPATSSSSINFNFGYPTPGPQTPTSGKVMDKIFFSTPTEWRRIREEMSFDHIVIGSGFGALGFIERTLSNNPNSKILMIERGPFFLPEHFQNLPVPYQKTLGGLSETFPWTLSDETRIGKYIKWQHGMVPFFGGRSIMWSAWCPRPLEDEMEGWPKYTISKAQQYFPVAEKLLNVISACKLDKGPRPPTGSRPIFGVLQEHLTKKLRDELSKVPSATRVMPAPLAVNAPQHDFLDFVKFSTAGPFLEIIQKQRQLAAKHKGSHLRVVTECVVQRILEQQGRATALETSRGVVPIGNANVVIATGCLPATTLVQNSFPESQAGERFTAHFISSIIARVPRQDYEFASKLEDLEIAAIYFAGKDVNNAQYHIQLTALSDKDPQKNATTAARHMPDVVATASLKQLEDSKDYVVFVCAVLGEINYKNPKNWFRRNPKDHDPTTNSILQVIESKEDSVTWETMDEGTFQALERILSPNGAHRVEYWHGDGAGEVGEWKAFRPGKDQYRVAGLVHEGSTMHLGEESNAVVGLDYRLKGSQNVYVTGTSLWPTSGSWNPTMTLVALSQHLADNLTPRL